jgi:hypothetical protein
MKWEPGGAKKRPRPLKASKLEECSRLNWSRDGAWRSDSGKDNSNLVAGNHLLQEDFALERKKSAEAQVALPATV